MLRFLFEIYSIKYYWANIVIFVCMYIRRKPRDSLLAAVIQNEVRWFITDVNMHKHAQAKSGVCVCVHAYECACVSMYEFTGSLKL